MNYYYVNFKILTLDNLSLVLHILLVITTCGLLGVAGLQAVLLTVQNYLLKKPAYYHLLRAMPALESVENTLFGLIWLGFSLLSIAWFTAHVYLPKQFTVIMALKIGCTALAWLVLAGLLLGRRYCGWRGMIAVRGTLLTVVLLATALLLSNTVAA